MEKEDRIAPGYFDRDYSLSELLSAPMASEIIDLLAMQMRMAVIEPDGRLLYGEARHLDQVSQALARTPPTGEKEFFHLPTAPEKSLAYPLIHEMERIGYLVFQAKDPVSLPCPKIPAKWVAVSIDRMINLNYRLLMTSGLHGEVVETSYSRLKRRTLQLKRSEARYRRLARSLEKAVARKSEEIKKAQIMILQQEKMACVGQLAAGVAHEINNPIGFMISNLNSLTPRVRDLATLLTHHNHFLQMACTEERTGASTLEPIRQAADRIQRLQADLDLEFLLADTQALITESLEGADRIQTIVRNLMAFTHPSVEHMETVDIHHCLDTTLSMLSSEMNASVRVVKIYGHIPLVRCFLREINQVFFSIIRNALQAVGQSGDVTISTRERNGRAVEITISDTGPGISEAHLTRIFEPFFTTREVGGGMGLGLYSAYKIMEKQGGRIEVESGPGMGAVFRIRIPGAEA